MVTILPGPLTGIRVLELADEKGQFCGKLMADMGADVVKIEPPEGNVARTVGPFLGTHPNPNQSLYFWHYNTSKRGITLNLEEKDGQNLFRRLASNADVILETFSPGYLESINLGYNNLKYLNDGLIMCSLTQFGQSGPWRDYRTSDLLHLAAGGQMSACGYDDEDIPNAPPIAPGGGQAWHTGSHYAYIAIVAALIYRSTTGLGQYIDASVHDACAITTESVVDFYIYTKQVALRQTGRHAYPSKEPRTQFICKDGKFINAQVTVNITPEKLRVLAEWMDTYGLAEDLLDYDYKDPLIIDQKRIHINDVVAKFISQLPQEDVYHGAQSRGFAWGSVRSPEDLLDDQHLIDRGFWVDVEHPELGRSFIYPGGGAIYNGSPWRISRRAPLIGEHNQEIYCVELGLRDSDLSNMKKNGVL